MPLANGDHGAAQAAVDGLDIRREAGEGKRALGEVNKMRRVVGFVAGERRGGGEPAGVAPEDLDHCDAGQRAIVRSDVAQRVREETGGGGISGRVIGSGDVVVDGFGDADNADLHARRLRGQRQPVRHFHGSVSAVRKDIADAMTAESAKHFFMFAGADLIPRSTEKGAWGLGRPVPKDGVLGIEIE